jgi:DNA-binding transcriptional regulator YiaG
LVVRTLRERGLSQAAVARRLNVAPSTVHRWVTETHSPTYRNGQALVLLAGVTKRTAECAPRVDPYSGDRG